MESRRVYIGTSPPLKPQNAGAGQIAARAAFKWQVNEGQTMGFLIRWAGAFALLAATYNPTQWNFTRWALTNWEAQLPITILLGLLLFVGYIIYLRATLRSIGVFGMLLIFAIVGTALWVMYDQGWINLDDSNLLTWIGIVALSIVLAIGLSWSIVRRHLSGQADVDDIDD